MMHPNLKRLRSEQERHRNLYPEPYRLIAVGMFSCNGTGSSLNAEKRPLPRNVSRFGRPRLGRLKKAARLPEARTE